MTPAMLPRSITADEFFDYCSRPENLGRFLELERGEVIELQPPTKPHGFVAGNVARVLGNYGAETGLGYVCTNDTGLLVERGPDTVRGPDVTFFSDDQDLDTMDRKYSTTVPRVVVEVISPTDRPKRVQRRVSEYLRLGVPLVWLIDPEDRHMTVYQAGEIPLVLEGTDELTGGGVLPGFRCRVADLLYRAGRPGVGDLT